MAKIIIKILHYPIDDINHPGVNPDSVLRPVLCHPAYSKYVEYETFDKQRYLQEIKDCYRTENVQINNVNTFTRNKDKVTCGKCKALLNGSSQKINELKYEISSLKTSINKREKTLASSKIKLKQLLDELKNLLTNQQ